MKNKLHIYLSSDIDIDTEHQIIIFADKNNIVRTHNIQLAHICIFEFNDGQDIPEDKAVFFLKQRAGAHTPTLYTIANLKSYLELSCKIISCHEKIREDL